MLIASWPVCLCILAKKGGKGYLEGIIIFLFYIFTNAVILPDIIYALPFIYPLYLTLLLIGTITFLGGHYRYTSLCLFLAGLVRPEAWVFAGIYAAWSVYYYVKTGRRNISALLPFVSPLLWMLFDYRLSGNPLYSVQKVSYYADVSDLLLTRGNVFWPIMADVTWKLFGGWLVIAGFVGLGYAAVKAERRSARAMIVLTFTPVLFYWLDSLAGGFYMFARFFTPTILGIYYGLVMGISLLIGNKVLRVSLLALLLIFTINKKAITIVAANLTTFPFVIETNKQVYNFIDVYLKTHPLPEKIAIGHVDIDSFSLRYGIEFSQHTVNIRDVAADINQFGQGGIIVWTYTCENASGLYFSFLAKPVKAICRGYKFTPIYITPNRLGVVYEVRRI